MPKSQQTDLRDFCSAELALANLGPSCRLLRITAIDHTGNPAVVPRDGAAERAFDDDVCTVWNAGSHPPHAIRGAVEEDAPITGLLLVPEMLPDGSATHVITLDDTSFLAHVGFATVLVHVVLFDKPAPAKTITVRTVASPSWVAWRAILPFTCSKITIPASLVDAPRAPPDPPSKGPFEILVPGKGTCAIDADCVPASCCHPRTCTAAGTAPRCDGVGCAQNVVPDEIGHGARCVCSEGKCAARRTLRL